MNNNRQTLYSVQACKLAGGKLAFPIIADIFSEVQSEVYIEPFCGTAVTLLNKLRDEKEIISDIDSTLISFLKEVRDEPDMFINRILHSRFGEDTFREQKEKANSDNMTQSESALAFAITSISSFDYNNINFRKNNADKRNNGYMDFYIENIYRASRRLAGVDIKHMDYKEALTKELLNNRKASIYIDAPHNKRKLGQSNGFNEQETEEMIRHIKDAKAFVGITAPRVLGNPYDRILGSKQGWYCYYLGSKNDYASVLDSQRKKTGRVNLWFWTNRILSAKIAGRLDYCLPITTREFIAMAERREDITKKKYYSN